MIFLLFTNLGLIKTLQQKQKCLEYSESKVLCACTQWQTDKHSDPHESVTLQQTSDTLSYNSRDPLLSSVKPQCLSHDERTVTTTGSSDGKLGEFRAALTVNSDSNKTDINQGSRSLSTTSSGVKEAAIKSAVKTSKGSSKATRSKNKKTRTPFIEHREDERTSFSRANFVTLQERLSADEMNILSQLAGALSLPDDVRSSLHAYLDRQRAHISGVDEPAAGDDAEKSPAVKSKKRKKRSKEQPVSIESVAAVPSKPLWTVDDVKDPERLKLLLEHAANLLRTDKRLLLEQAVEHDRLMKENAYHDKMASFVELCINTGMVSSNLKAVV